MRTGGQRRIQGNRHEFDTPCDPCKFHRIGRREIVRQSTSKLAAMLLVTIFCQSCNNPETQDAAALEQTVTAETPIPSENITAASFGCISDLTPVDRFFVGNLNGNLEATVAVAKSKTGGVYPAGSVVQLVPGEVMVKRVAGYNAKTKDWEFFELDASKSGTSIRKRGADGVINRFGGNCLECHEKAKPQWDLICQLDHGCDPIPLTTEMIRALQKTDPRCKATPLTAEEGEALKALKAQMAT
jgi:hypothetical protein